MDRNPCNVNNLKGVKRGWQGEGMGCLHKGGARREKSGEWRWGASGLAGMMGGGAPGSSRPTGGWRGGTEAAPYEMDGTGRGAGRFGTGPYGMREM